MIELPLGPASREPRCTRHPTEDAGRCGPCRSEWIAVPAHADLAMGDADTTSRRDADLARRREIAAARWDALVPAEFRSARLGDFADHPDIIAVIERALAHFESYGEPPIGLRVHGPTGTGKTRLLNAVLHAIITGSRPVQWASVSALAMYRALQPSAANPDLALHKLQSVPLLLIDDLGARRYTEWVEEVTLELLDERYSRRLPVLVSTNLNTNDLTAAIGERVVSRLRQRCLRIVLDGDDRRQAPTLEGLADAQKAATA